MSILEHIAELRGRLVKSCVALVVTTTVAFAFLYDPVIQFLLRSYCELPAHLRIATAAGDANCGLAALSPLEPLSIRIRISLTVGLLLAMPIVAFQLWRFITPGLKPNEKRYAIPFALATTLLFAAGVTLAFITLPKAIGFLASLGGSGVLTFFTADRYLRFVLFMGLAFGASFEFPLVLVFLSLVGALSSRAMLRAWRPAVAVISHRLWQRRFDGAPAVVGSPIVINNDVVITVVENAFLELGFDKDEARVRAGTLVYAGIGFVYGRDGLPSPTVEQIQALLTILVRK